MGFKHLKGLNKRRVVSANFLYAWTKKMILRLHNAGVAWSVENPASSLMWLTDPFMELMSAIPELIAFFFSYMYVSSEAEERYCNLDIRP